uniref:Asparagine synthetase domain-containing protein n=1 Tax=Anaerobacillus isosaccharinicus TaxID=1532552 RepID=A0A7S7L9P0_9BACI|nr:asparagine synthase-related protein [Anaerobacillus isosaccharinicus]MBA5584750.1 hypothetical protein [Anaerobacillus isosaccharinicus]QOY36881.1 hypothetical protein AWH56_004315 [Anaerobacillus isosaccharinicus]
MILLPAAIPLYFVANQKFVLRKALEEIVPDQVVNRKKTGFPVPIRHWPQDW